MNIKTRINAIAAIPVVCLLGFASVPVVGKWSELKASERLASDAQVAVGVSELVHNVQAERGMSSVYLGDGSNEGELAAQRGKVDGAITSLQQVIDESQIAGRDPAAADLVSKVADGFSALTALRSSVTGRAITAEESARQYTALIETANRSIGYLAREGAELNPEIGRALSGLSALSEGKEQLGRARAVGTPLLRTQFVDAQVVARLAGFFGAAETQFSSLEDLLPPEQADHWRSLKTSPTAEQLEQLRAKVMGSAGGPPTVSAADWFAALTAHMDALHQLQAETAAQAKTAAEANAGGALWVLLFALVTALGVAGGAAAIAFLVGRSIVKPMHKLANEMNALGAGNKAIEVAAAHRTDEFGEMGRALLGFRDAAIEKEKQSAEKEKIELESMYKSTAFAGSSVAMMMIDRDFKITYVNESNQKLLMDNADAFRKIWPNFNPEKIVGSCIDMFHKSPTHQRQLLSDPARLPYRTDITIGDLKFALHVSAIFDANRRYVGNVLEWEDVTRARLNAGMLAALDRSQAIIEFGLDGTILNANENFLQTLGYSLNEVKGKHHSIFVEPAYRQSVEYRTFWDALKRGEFQAAKYLRIGKGGREVWIQASYNPIVDAHGKPFKVVKFAADVTQVENDRKTAEAERAKRAAEQSEVVTSLASGLRQLSEGNVTVRLSTAFPADYEQLRTDYNEAIAKLQDALKRIATGAESISTGSAEISNAADDLSRRTEQQAASLEETAAALDEITATVKKSAEGASAANALVVTARTDGEASGEVVRKAVAAMGEIERSAKQINQIIGVIDEIAFQTNLLALNAGVEAARAGDAGRGFAVVASEVRALAQRSADAAKQIKGLISESSQQVESGVDLVGEAGDSLVRILKQIGQINQLVSEIASSAQEQSTGLSQVNSAVNQMDQVTQQNAAMVEQSTAASRSLAKESADLAALVAEFKIGERVATRPARTASDSDSQTPRTDRRPAPQLRTTAQRKPAPSPAVEADWEEF
jgi:methyl-accepting chemotaxis protein